MPIVPPNATYSTTRRQGRVLIANPTKDTLPKAGRNGTTSMYAGSVETKPDKLPRTRGGNAFGPNLSEVRTPIDVHNRVFGERSNAGIATSPDNRTATDHPHPNDHFFNTNTSFKRAARTQGGWDEGYKPASPYAGGPNQAVLTMPHERTGIGANTTRNLFRLSTYRASAGGASKTLPSDTPFHPIAVKKEGKPLPGHAVEAVKVPRFQQPSFFRSNANLWIDPNGSFSAGAVNTQTGRVGAGRWQTTKRGAAG